MTGGSRGKVTVATLGALKARGEKAVFVTAYDYATATFAERAGVDMVLIGDSAAMTMMGLPNTLGIGMDEMCVFVRSVCRALSRSCSRRCLGRPPRTCGSEWISSSTGSARAHMSTVNW